MELHLTSPKARKERILLDHRQWALAREGYEAGHSVAYLAREFRVTPQTINRRRKLDRWMKKGPARLPLAEPPERDAFEPAATLEQAARVTVGRLLRAFNADDRSAVQEFSRTAESLMRLHRQFELSPGGKPAAPAERVFTAARDIYDLLKDRLGVDEDGNPAR